MCSSFHNNQNKEIFFFLLSIRILIKPQNISKLLITLSFLFHLMHLYKYISQARLKKSTNQISLRMFYYFQMAYQDISQQLLTDFGWRSQELCLPFKSVMTYRKLLTVKNKWIIFFWLLRETFLWVYNMKKNECFWMVSLLQMKNIHSYSSHVYSASPCLQS